MTNLQRISLVFSRRFLMGPVVLFFALGAAILAPVGGALAQEYKLGAGDKLKVIVLADPEFSGDYEVDASGSISVRMIGRMSVLGMTTAEVEAALVERYRSGGYLRNPKLSVELMAARPFYILGEVVKPGNYTYVAGITVAQAVAMAGGYTRRASTSRIKVKRFGSTTEDPVTEDSRVSPGDILKVPERFF